MNTIQKLIDGCIISKYSTKKEISLYDVDNKNYNIPESVTKINLVLGWKSSIDNINWPSKLEHLVINYKTKCPKLISNWPKGLKFIELIKHEHSGGLMQLVAYGTQDCYLTGNNENINNIHNLDINNNDDENYNPFPDFWNENIQLKFNKFDGLYILPNNVTVIHIRELKKPLLDLPFTLQNIKIWDIPENKHNISLSKIPFGCNIDYYKMNM